MKIWIPPFAADVNYDRPKLVTINDTPINISFTAGEEPAAATVALSADGSGSTGIMNINVDADADESVGADVQRLFRIEDLQVIIDTTTGRATLSASIIPVKGDGTDGVTQSLLAVHDEGMDAWQTGAGRARQV